ncbi:MAG: winged helix-turn-helix domain-containing protein, partial [Candidatus Baltobacteraceae bacterium]
MQIADQLVEAIESGQLKPGDRLPAMRELAAQLACALVTVSQAYDLLTARGRLISRVGRGTFVADAPSVDAPFARRWEP